MVDLTIRIRPDQAKKLDKVDYSVSKALRKAIDICDLKKLAESD